MINYFPSIYPDELLYSQFARFHSKSGNISYVRTKKVLFKNNYSKNSFELLNELNEDAFRAVTRNESIEDLIMNHTMFPYYTRFLPLEQRKELFDLIRTVGSRPFFSSKMFRAKDGYKQYAKYCPICANNDRNLYGETYWHRLHQMRYVNICPTHHCYLINVDNVIEGQFSFITADEVVADNIHSIICKNDTEIKVAEYIAKVFQQKLDMTTDFSVGEFFNNRLADTNHLFLRGKRRNMAKIQKSFSAYYKDLDYEKFTSLKQLDNIFRNVKINIFSIYLLSLFLEIPAEEFAQIESNQKKNWDKIDNNMFPVMKAIVDQCFNCNNKPKRVSIRHIGELLNLQIKDFRNMPRCMELISSKTEKYEEYWARKIVWAVKKILAENESLTFYRIYHLTSLNKNRVLSSIDYLGKYGDEKTVEIIKNLTTIEAQKNKDYEI